MQNRLTTILLNIGNWTYFRLKFIANNNLLEATLINNKNTQEETYNAMFIYLYDNNYPLAEII